MGGCCLQWGVEVEHRRRRLRARVAGGWRRQRQWSGDRRRRIVGGVGGGAGGGVTGMASGRAGRGPPFAGKGHSGWVRRGSAGEQGWSAPRERRLLRVVGGYLWVTSPWSATAPRARTPPRRQRAPAPDRLNRLFRWISISRSHRNNYCNETGSFLWVLGSVLLLVSITLEPIE